MLSKFPSVLYLCISLQPFFISNSFGNLSFENCNLFQGFHEDAKRSSQNTLEFEKTGYRIVNAPPCIPPSPPCSPCQEAPVVVDCPCPPDIMTYSTFITVGHIDPGGIGYNHGYTTLEALFFATSSWGPFWPFLDLRFHVFNNNEYAANAGVGVRFEPDCSCFIYGFNVYGDYRSADDRRKHFFQLGFGVELLSDCLDIRINGYIPFERKKLLKRCVFDDFDGDFRMTRDRVLGSFSGFNIELGTWLSYECCCCCYDIYVAGGPYYYTSRCRNTVGGQFRVGLPICNYIWLEGIFSHDHLFKTRAQGAVYFTFPFGGCCAPDCGQGDYQDYIQRNEIIILDRFCEWDSNF